MEINMSRLDDLVEVYAGDLNEKCGMVPDGVVAWSMKGSERTLTHE
jgi:hypothetical protein